MASPILKALIYLFFPIPKTWIYLAKEGKIVLLNLEGAFGTVSTQYSYYTDFQHQCFLKELAVMLSKCTNINDHAIDIEEDKQLPYKLLYSLGW